MTRLGFSTNPFSVTSPEDLNEEQMVQLFVDVYSDFPKIKLVGHTFIHGARGTGKSMMLRYLEPLVQIKAENAQDVSELDFFAVHIPIKNSLLDYIEFGRLDGAPYYILAEHMMVMHSLVKLAESLQKVCNDHCNTEEIKRFYNTTFVKLLHSSGHVLSAEQQCDAGCCDYFGKIKEIAENLFLEAKRYLSKHAFIKEILPYENALCGWLDFFVPFVSEAKKLSFLPAGPIFLMFDDADNLPVKMQKILNTWVSCRTTDSLCLKISTQLRYKTYKTISGKFIEPPHDYTEIDITKLYSAKTTHFYHRVEEIIKKRLEILEIETEPEDFFPPDVAQEEKVKAIKAEFTERAKKGEGRAQRHHDDATRYARPEYIRRLGRSAHSYSYAGLDSLVNLANGVVRWFLEPAALMYSEEQNKKADEKIKFIPHELQDSVIKKWSADFLVSDFDKYKQGSEESSEELLLANKLYNLINALGGLFQKVVKTEGISERRLFTIMLSTEADKEVKDVLALGVEWGYFQHYTIGSKEGIGRKDRFILSRRLGPYFKLDVSGFAGNLSVTSDALKTAFISPDLFIKERFGNLVKPAKDEQISLF